MEVRKMKFILAVVVCLWVRKGITKTKIPPLIFYMLVGILLGPFGLNVFEGGVLAQSNTLRKLALAIILLRAGTSLEISSLKAMQAESILLSFVPALFEAFAITLSMLLLTEFSLIESLMLAFIISAVSPAVVIPAMIKLKDKNLGTNKNIPDIILGAASLDDIFVMTIFTIILNIYSGQSSSIAKTLLHVPLTVMGGIVIGSLLAFCLKHLRHFLKIPKLFILLSAFLLLWLETNLPISSYLAIIAFGLGINHFRVIESLELKNYLNTIWAVGEIVLFMLLGASINLESLHLIRFSSLFLIIFGLVFRMIGVTLSLLGSHLNRKEKVFIMIANTPKATVQAALAGIPLSYGVAKGEHILALASFSIVLTAPLAAYFIDHSSQKLLSSESI
ncbi:sodium:proton antiporter [Erysipelothrix urinaevulpis]|uniref:cation:proton antiporter n=1 Tax=Erysipelothrix urinaevulpis TaxID=2683717 RepID=UPI00135B565D|nr:cation:proton antiporter [Erysipelothrix urinaevulpis]